MTACSSAVIGWDTTGGLHNLSLIVTNHLVNLPTTLAVDRRQTSSDYVPIYLTLGTFADPGILSSYTWSPVNVPAGQYVVRAIASELLVPARSSEFTVSNGTDLSCLGVSPPSSSPVTTPISSAPAETFVPVGATSSSASSHVAGAIAGGVIGGVVLVAALIGLCLFLRSSRRFKRAGGGSSSSRGGLGKWNGLSSRDSNLGSTLPTTTGDLKTHRKHETVESVGGFSVGSRHGPIGSEEDLTTLAEEKSIASKGRSVEYIETVSPLDVRRFSTSSVPPSPLTSTPSNRSRAKSTSQNRAMALAKLDSSGMERQASVSSNYARRPSLDGHVLSITGEVPVSSPTSPSAETIPMNRSFSGNTRRATRKPVPTYDSFEVDTPISPASGTISREDSMTSHGIVSRQDSVASSHVPYGDSRAMASGSSPALGLRSGAVSREDLVAAGLGLPNLNHKSSFGSGQPLHYLIPDMPPPARD
ncbi:unnamed protein product [Somion occarium]